MFLIWKMKVVEKVTFCTKNEKQLKWLMKLAFEKHLDS